MEGGAAAGLFGATVSLLGVTLQKAHFSGRYPGAEAASRPAPTLGFGMELEVSRPAALRLSVALTVFGEEGLPYNLLATYAAHFAMHPSVPEASREAEWREVAFRRAPALLYPYVREVIANLTGRGAHPPLLLPELPEPLDFSADEHRLPLPPWEPAGGGEAHG